MGISRHLGAELEQLLNYWSKVRITDAEVKKLIQVAMAPNKEVLKKLNRGALDEASTVYKNIVDDVFSYSISNPSQLLETTQGTLFGPYNAITGYFQNVRKFRNDEAKFKSITEGTAKVKAQGVFDLCMSFMKTGDLHLFSN